MFLNLEQFERCLHEVEQEEEKENTLRTVFDKVLLAKNLSELDEISTETLKMVMLEMTQYINAYQEAGYCMNRILSNATQLKRVRRLGLL